MRFPQYKLGLNMPGVLSIKHIKFRCAWIILQSLTRERFNGERKKKTKVAKRLNNVYLLCSLLLLMALSFLKQLLSGDQKDHAVLSSFRIH